jgi:hypothetical protein
LLGRWRWLAGVRIETVFGCVVGRERVTPIEVTGREVTPAVRDRCARDL